ncbi:hypothetical protein [Nitrosococcus watsonii]|uniref:Uncharacterized protein n=1 Tax=Nitrosococcus watsoni (strain C-113) TaxID=105559 RepID=D8KC38_NITWC|nr:hypothetical protein [Nitrosococcus watsonii]ADJ29709.1 conserved hypothetical protein [Nitrosococcus watsonii C-113]
MKGMLLPLPSPSTAPTFSFWRMLFTALGVMVLSGVLLVGGFLAYYLQGFTLPEVQPRVWRGDTLQLVAGQGASVGKTLELQALSSGGQAIISSGKMTLTAAQYPVLEYQLQGLQPGMEVVFFWRGETAPEKVVSLPLRWDGEESTLMRLDHHPAWRGAIIEFGLGFRNTLPAPVVIKELDFKPLSATTLLALVGSDWRTFQGWSQRSINFVTKGNALVPPLVGAAAWAGLALCLYAMGLVFQRRYWDWRVIGTIFLLAWLAVDIHWQADLWQQLQATYERYGGKGWAEKHRAAEEDKQLFEFAAEIKAHLGPIPQRVFLVTAKSLAEDPYTRLRVRYHLLPYNIHDDGAHLPRQADAQKGDYLLILGPTPEFMFDPEKGFLRGRGRERTKLAVKRIHESAMGVLYQLR